jgi:hypothetical protein
MDGNDYMSLTAAACHGVASRFRYVAKFDRYGDGVQHAIF